jgi:hypothetical protein
MQDHQKKAARKRLIVVGWRWSGMLGAELNHFLGGQVIPKACLGESSHGINKLKPAVVINGIDSPSRFSSDQINTFCGTPGA